MKQAILDMFKSKKFLAALASVLVAVGAKVGWNITTEELLPILSPLMAYIVGQGIADNGKERAKIEKIDKA